MDKRQVVVPMLAALLFVCSTVQAVQRRVPGQYSTIQAAINASVAGDEVVISPGSYPVASMGYYDFKGKAITVRSTDPDDPAVVAATVIDLTTADYYRRMGFLFTNGEGPTSVLAGLTIVAASYGVNTANYYGVAIRCQNSSPTVRKCVIQSSWGSVAPFVVALVNSQTRLQDCTIGPNNIGGIYVSGGSPTIERCRIIQDYLNRFTDTPVMGGGLHCSGGTTLVRDCFIYGNSAQKLTGETSDPCGIAVTGGSLTLQGCTLKKNGRIAASAGSQLILANSLLVPSATADVISVTGASSMNMSYCASAATVTSDAGSTVTYGSGNSAPPTGEGADALGRIKAGSPYMNAGDPAYIAVAGETDIEGSPRVAGGRVDIGCYEVSAMPVVLAPAAGDVIAAGSRRLIRWTSGSQAVDLYYSLDGGTTWNSIATGLPGIGDFSWTAPSDVSDNYLVAADGEGGTLRGVSGRFAIRPYVTSSAPEAIWSSLGGTSHRRGLSAYSGPELGCTRLVIPFEGRIYGGVVVRADGTIYGTTGDMLFSFQPNGSSVTVSETRLPGEATCSPSMGPDGTIYVGCREGRLLAFDGGGSLKWNFATGAMITGAPAVDSAGRSFVGSGDGIVYGFGPDGSELWRFSPASGTSIPRGFFASPTIGLDGSVYVADAYKPVLYALDPNTGVTRWQADFTAEGVSGNASVVPGRLMAAPAIGPDGMLYLAFDGYKKLYALTQAGELKWSFDMTDTTPGLYETFGTATSPYTNASPWSEPAVGPDGTIYVSTDDPHIRAIEPNGVLKWARRCGTMGGFTLTVGADGLVYACGDDKNMYVMRPDGTLASVFSGSGWLSYPVVGADGKVYVSDAGGVLWQIAADSSGARRDLHRLWDIDGTGFVDFTDFAMMAADWAGSASGYYLVGDVDRDGDSDAMDLAIVAQMWLSAE